MACLRRKGGADLRPLHLRPYQLVGRWQSSHIVIDRPGVSKQHATIQWLGEHWLLRDLGSRNGTLHNGALVDPAQPRELEVGDEIAFGERDEVWIVDDIEPPGLLLVPVPPSSEPALHVSTTETFHALPSGDDPQVTIMCGADGICCAELACGEIVELDGGKIITLLGRRYEVVLPETAAETGDADTPLVESHRCGVHFELEVSANEETAALTVMFDGWTRPRRLRASVPLYLLVCLARRRREDGGLPEDVRIESDVILDPPVPGTQGWMETEAACKALGITREQLGVHVFRVRESLKELGVPHVGTVIERRKGWIRTGIDPTRIRVLRARAGAEPQE